MTNSGAWVKCPALFKSSDNFALSATQTASGSTAFSTSKTTPGVLTASPKPSAESDQPSRALHRRLAALL